MDTRRGRISTVRIQKAVETILGTNKINEIREYVGGTRIVEMAMPLLAG